MTVRLLITAICTLLISISSHLYGEEATKKLETVPATSKNSLKAAYTASDSLKIFTDDLSDANVCLSGLSYDQSQFECQVRQISANELGNPSHVALSFPSPVNSGYEEIDTVHLDWYLAHNEDGQIKRAPAYIVVHELGGSRTVGKFIAKAISNNGVHAFLIQLPHYGQRKADLDKSEIETFFSSLKQAVADVRRSKDAVLEMPWVETDKLGVVGISFGAIISSTAASLDSCFTQTHLILPGGNLCEVLRTGIREAEKLREKIAEANLNQETVDQYLNRIEPTRVAHRLDRSTTWVYTGIFDKVIPRPASDALVKTIGLSKTNRWLLPADHHSGAIFLPLVIQNVIETLDRPAPM